jgi:Lipopolysaccharide kinase (Kdo/WaaP) family
MARGYAVETITELLDQHGTLYAAAAADPDRREYRGRGVAYGTTLGGRKVVVRHSRHGGLLAPLTRDVFLSPTRAPHECAVARHLTCNGVLTPEFVGYLAYRAGPLLRRVDVVTQEIEGASDLAARPATAEANAAVEVLLDAMARAGALHHDLNAKNILLAPDGAALKAYVIDVDRVVLLGAGVDSANRARLRRSIAKLGLGYHV